MGFLSKLFRGKKGGSAPPAPFPKKEDKKEEQPKIIIKTNPNMVRSFKPPHLMVWVARRKAGGRIAKIEKVEDDDKAKLIKKCPPKDGWTYFFRRYVPFHEMVPAGKIMVGKVLYDRNKARYNPRTKCLEEIR